MKNKNCDYIAWGCGFTELDFPDGTKSPIFIKDLGGHRFFAYFVRKGRSLTKITTFDAAGIALRPRRTPRQ
jgi:hypothetical protein